MNTRIVTLQTIVLAAMIALLAGPAVAYKQYNDGCNNCHESFTGNSSPKGSVFPDDSKHDMHRDSAFMNTECDLCHTGGADFTNPFLGSSNGTANNAGLGCTGCHEAFGLRAHHDSSSCFACHQDDGVPPPENEKPPYYGTADTNADESCNTLAQSNINENWTIGDFVGLDNDGDDLYDASDPDCSLPPMDGRTVLLHRSTDLRWFSYTLAGDIVIGKGWIDMTRSSAYEAVSRSDFDGDGEGDVLLRDVTGAENWRWVMHTLDGQTITSRGFIDLTRNPDFVVISSDDFDNDGRADLLLRHTDGRWLMYLIDGLTIKSQGIVDMPTDTSLAPVAVADFDGDGKSDVLVRSPDGSWQMFLLNGLTVASSGVPALTTNTDFSMVTADDFDGDGDADILLRRTDGRWFMYLMNGVAVSTQGAPAMVENSEFEFKATADFNGDGKADVLLRRTDGRFFIYVMDGLTVLDEGSPDMTGNTTFRVVEAEDFDLDGKADVFMRRDDGPYYMYLMDGPVVIGGSRPDMTKNPAWHPIVD